GLAVAAGAVAAAELRVVAGRGASSALALAAPVFNPRRADERIGTLVALLDPERLLEAVTAGGVHDGSVSITLRDPDQVLGTVHATAQSPSKTRSDAPPDATFAKTVTVPRLADVDSPALSVVVRQPARVALASILSLRERLTQVALAVLLLSAIAGAFVAWRISVPIRRLTASADAIATRGRPEPLLELPTGAGEVGVLGAAFE